MADPNLNPEQIVKKRRTKRIIQAVPLTVTGVDALGRPFRERTSTLTVNCQGCRYQSKHYVPENTWVTLEIPPSEPGRAPRSARARVNWIQRPRTERELFQIGVELEVSGNVWGIAFPPNDWFPFPDASSSRELPVPIERTEIAPPVPEWVGEAPPGPSLAPETPEDNVRVIPIAGSKDEMAQMTRQVTRLVSEARKQIDSQLAEVERARQADFERRIENQLQTAIQKLENLTQALDARENEARVTMEQMRLSSEQAATNELRLWQDQMDRCAADAQAHVAEMDRAAKNLREQIAAAGIEGTRWPRTLDAEMESATGRWREKTETLIEEASRLATEQFRENAEATRTEIEKLLHERIADRQSQVATEGQDTVIMLRAAIDQEIAKGESMFSQLQESASQLEAKRRELSAHIEADSDILAQRGNSILEAQSSELTRQAESVAARLSKQFQSTLEAMGRRTVDEFAGELHQRLSPQMARVEEATNKLIFDREEAEKTLAEQQQRVWQASDRNLQDTVARGKELLAQIETEFGESGREAMARWISELESKATEISQGSFEALYKSAEWYEKKAQNQMQATLQKGVDQATGHLRDKAAELSGTFARELDQCSRSYVEHAQGQIESATASAERISQQIAESVDAAAAQFSERAGQIGQQEFEARASKAKTAFEQIFASMEARSAQIRSELESDARGLAEEFRRALSQHAQETLAQGVQASENLISESQMLERQFGISLEPLGMAAIDAHKKRLENASNAWLLTTVTRLTQQSEALVAELAEATEKKLKALCGAVITEMGTTLRQRGGLTAPFTSPSAPPAGNPLKEQK